MYVLYLKTKRLYNYSNDYQTWRGRVIKLTLEEIKQQLNTTKFEVLDLKDVESIVENIREEIVEIKQDK